MPGLEGFVAAYGMVAEAGVTESTGSNQWSWIAPTQPGVYWIQLWDAIHNDTMTLNVFEVPAPASS